MTKIVKFTCAVVRAIIFMLNDLFGKPDDFRDTAYGFFTNQLGHIVAGSFMFFCVWRILPEPNDLTALSTILIGYICFELLVHGWQKWDTVLDVWFVFSGAVMSVFFDVEFVFEHWQSLSALWGVLFVLFLITWFKYYRKRSDHVL